MHPESKAQSVPLSPPVKRMLQRLESADDWTREDLGQWHALLEKHPKRRVVAVHLIALARRFFEAGAQPEARVLAGLAATAVGGLQALERALDEHGVARDEGKKLMRHLKDERASATVGLEGAKDTARVRGFSLRAARKKSKTGPKI